MLGTQETLCYLVAGLLERDHLHPTPPTRMWLLIFWLSSPFNVSSGDARQPTLAVHSQAFHTERACRDALRAIKKENDGEFSLRGVCVSDGNTKEDAENS